MRKTFHFLVNEKSFTCFILFKPFLLLHVMFLIPPPQYVMVKNVLFLFMLRGIIGRQVSHDSFVTVKKRKKKQADSYLVNLLVSLPFHC